MKRVEDFVTIEQFKEKTDQVVLPIIQNAVDDAYKSPLYKKYKSMKYGALGSFPSMILSALIAIICFIALKDAMAKLVLFGIFGLAAFICFILTLVFVKLAKKRNLIFRSFIASKLREDNIYGKAVNAADTRWKYRNDDFEPSSMRHNYDLSTERFAVKEYESFKPASVPRNAWLESTSPVQTITIDDKYHAHVSVAEWLLITRNKNGHETKQTWYSALLKIDARALKERDRANFTYFDNKNGLQPVEMENKEFNKIFKVASDNPTKMYQLFTPLAMEELVKLINQGLQHTNIKKAKDFEYQANNDVVYCSFISPSGFMDIDVPVFVGKKDKFVAKIYKDVVTDIYTLYFVLALSYIPVYLY
ncbi:DUF3137 domain-containing protein [Mycoplasma sp. 1199]|uniref:DUF3137 domain-containing protein n=1 Tax=Mycoplasma sp. 1199 TaxID=3108526 RepID=UPI002B1E37C8|nr:DUF3137 domain-containing protein [Mycoplasma sp. 1199]MEA4206146.1 DUF3137 domain-containing protein [Mycoplasma sp. 1199]